MNLYLVRHGETYSNIGVDKSYDPVLTEIGKKQADYLGESLKDVHFDKIYSSHLIRAIQTTASVAKYQNGNPQIIVVPEFCERGLPIDFEADIEYHKSVYDNIFYTKTSIEKDYHGDIERAQFALNDYVLHPAYDNPKAEKQCGDGVIKTNPENVLIVAHGGINAIILSCLVGFRFDINMNVVQQNTCVNKFELFLHNGIPRVKFISYNDISHLPKELATEHP